MRTDFKIISTVASGNTAQVWMKNIGSEQIPYGDIQRSDVFCGAVGNFDRLAYVDSLSGNGQWTADFIDDTSYDLNDNGMWDAGETIKITAKTSLIPGSGSRVYFQFALPNGVWRSNEFTVS
jgi:flagellar protein FlaG